MKRLLFAIFSVILVVLLGILIWTDYEREWLKYQQLSQKMERERAKAQGKPIRLQPLGIKQVIVGDLNRVDRCMTCHTGIDNPFYQNAPQPFRTHPGDYLARHPIEKFACTVCHNGQGRATTVTAAHGLVKHWNQPMFSKDLIQASCVKCHGDVARLPGAEQIAFAKTLFREAGCIGCHGLFGAGTNISVDLTTVGSKVRQELDFTYVKGEHTVANWFYEHFLDPQQVTPGYPEQKIPPSAMPNFHFTDEEAKALTAYMMGLTDEAIPPTYRRLEQPQPQPQYASKVEAGRGVFKKYGCIGCHNVDGTGGRKNYNSQTFGEVPSLTYVAEGYTKEELKTLIKQGRTPGKQDPDGPIPPLWMPAWEGKISEPELDDLAEYLYSLLPQDTVQWSSE